jgi:hypothetical protein
MMAGGRRTIGGVPASVSSPATIDIGPPAGRRARWSRRLINAVAQLQGGLRPMPLIAIGEGADLIPPDAAGIGRVIMPAEGRAAGAIGAALAPVSVTVERVLGRATATPERRAELAAEAVSLTVQNGADEARTKVVELDEVELPYLPHSSLCVRARADGPLQLTTRSSWRTAERQAS